MTLANRHTIFQATENINGSFINFDTPEEMQA